MDPTRPVLGCEGRCVQGEMGEQLFVCLFEAGFVYGLFVFVFEAGYLLM